MKRKKTAGVSINHLILLVIWNFSEKKEKCTFEKLTKECFETFPESFSLGNYPLPDSRKLDRPIRLLKSKKMVKPASGSGLVPTKKGEAKAREINRVFSQEKLKLWKK